MNVTTSVGHNVAVRFDSANLAARAVTLRGWALGRVAAADVGRTLLGTGVRAADLPVVTGRWTAARRTDPTRPLGPVDALVALSTSAAATVEVAMGSQAWPPSDAAAPAWRVELGVGEQLVVDGRCSFRVDRGAVAAVLWTAV